MNSFLNYLTQLNAYQLNVKTLHFSDLENSLTNNIETAEKFEDIKFEYPYIPSDLNERLAASEFTKK